jgi:hypothetical protein
VYVDLSAAIAAANMASIARVDWLFQRSGFGYRFGKLFGFAFGIRCRLVIVAIVESLFSLPRRSLARYSSTVSQIAPVLTRHTRHKKWTEDYLRHEQVLDHRSRA